MIWHIYGLGGDREWSWFNEWIFCLVNLVKINSTTKCYSPNSNFHQFFYQKAKSLSFKTLIRLPDVQVEDVNRNDSVALQTGGQFLLRTRSYVEIPTLLLSNFEPLSLLATLQSKINWVMSVRTSLTIFLLRTSSTMI